MPQNYFEIAMATISIAGFFISLRGLFPSYERSIRYIVSFSLGAIFGSLMIRTAAIKPPSSMMDTSIILFAVQIGFVFSIVISLIIISSITLGANPDNRHKVAGLSSVVLFLITGITMGLINSPAAMNVSSLRNLDELVSLGKYYEQNRQYGLAIEYYQKAIRSNSNRKDVHIEKFLSQRISGLSSKMGSN